MDYRVFLVILRIKIKEVNLLMSCEGKELVLKNCSKWLGNYGLKILESLVMGLFVII